MDDSVRRAATVPIRNDQIFALVDLVLHRDDQALGSFPFSKELVLQRAGRGCQYSGGTGGARLVTTGTTNPDSLVLTSAGELPTALSIFLQGSDTSAPVPFGDGLRCASGVLKRLYVKSGANGVATAPETGDPAVTQQSANLGDTIPLGATRYYQTYYRDAEREVLPRTARSDVERDERLLVAW